jgi:hypothetical protein
MPATPSDRQGSENADPQQEREANGILKQTQRQSLLHLAFQRYEEKQRELDEPRERFYHQLKASAHATMMEEADRLRRSMRFDQDVQHAAVDVDLSPLRKLVPRQLKAHDPAATKEEATLLLRHGNTLVYDPYVYPEA